MVQLLLPEAGVVFRVHGVRVFGQATRPAPTRAKSVPIFVPRRGGAEEDDDGQGALRVRGSGGGGDVQVGGGGGTGGVRPGQRVGSGVGGLHPDECRQAPNAHSLAAVLEGERLLCVYAGQDTDRVVQKHAAGRGVVRPGVQSDVHLLLYL